MPGMVDSHVHAPQFENMGKGYDVPLLEWLQKYTFPAEARFADVKYAKEVYTQVVVCQGCVRRLMDGRHVCYSAAPQPLATLHPCTTTPV